MESPWRRTLASVFLLLSPHSFMCQNAGPAGSLQPLPLLKEPCIKARTNPQQINLTPPATGFCGKFVPQCLTEGLPKRMGPVSAYPQQCSAPQVKIPPSSQGAGAGIANKNILPQLQSSVCNTLANANIPTSQAPSLNIVSAPLVENKPFNTSPTINLSPIKEVPSISISPALTVQCPNFDFPSVTNLPVSQGLQPKVLPAPIVSNSQNQMLPCSQRPFVPTTGSPLNVASAAGCPNQKTLTLPSISNPIQNSQSCMFPNQKTLTLPSISNPIQNSQSCMFPNQKTLTLPSISNPIQNSQSCMFPNQKTLTLPSISYPIQNSQSCMQPPVDGPFKVTTDLTSLNILPAPNLPISVPTQNCAPISQVPVQPMAYPKSIVPVDYVFNTPVTPNYQVAVLPSVYPVSVPLFNNNFCRNPMPITEEFNSVPINLEINVPAPIMPEPQITIITAYPPPLPPPVPVADSSDVSFELVPQYPFPPIIIEGKRSKSRSLLPLILIALIANDGFGSGNCCPCDCASSSIPIPYPIPIPTNNPIIITGKKGSKAKPPVKSTN